MNEMYDMSILAHSYGVMAVVVVIFINFLMLFSAKNVSKYTRAMMLFMPIGSIAIGVVVFTGIVMMAAKHLDFTLANIAMIIFAVVLIILEARRSLKLKYLSRKQNAAFVEYKAWAYKVLLLELFITIVLSIWMWI